MVKRQWRLKSRFIQAELPHQEKQFEVIIPEINISKPMEIKLTIWWKNTAYFCHLRELTL